VAVAGGLQVSGVGPGGIHTCAVTTGDRAYCWGDNSSGQLGDGTTATRLAPVAVAGGLQINGVGAGHGGFTGHTCGLTTGDRAYCWGSNFVGQLGDGTTTDRLTPVAVAGAM
jgi:alpha-tubulin suppressor-like RCC1 family protein